MSDEAVFYLVALEPLPICLGKFTSYSDAKAVQDHMKIETDLVQPEIPLRDCWTLERRRQLWVALTQPSSEDLIAMEENKGTTDDEIYDALAKHAPKYEPPVKGPKKARVPRTTKNGDAPPRVVQKGAVAKVIEVFNASPFRWDDPDAKAKAKAAFELCVAAGVNKSTAAGNIRRLARKLQSEQDLARDIDKTLS